MTTVAQALFYTCNVAPPVLTIGVSCYAAYAFLEDMIWVKDIGQKKAYCSNIRDSSLDEGTQKILHELSKEMAPIYLPEFLSRTNFYATKKANIQLNGSSRSDYGSLIGIPQYFKYRKPEDVDITAIKESYNFNSLDLDRLKDLRNSLVLSENAKKFALASAFHYENNNHGLVKLGIIPSAGLSYGLTFILEQMCPRLYEHLLKELAVICSVFLVFATISFFIEKVYYRRLQVNSDIKAAEMGTEFIDGALEYFDKTLEMNKILVELEPSLEWVELKRDGNEIGTYLPLTRRQQRFLQYLDKAKKESENKRAVS